jgi:hypothetical protein
MLPRLSRPYLPLMLGGKPPEKLWIGLPKFCSMYCRVIDSVDANGSRNIMSLDADE